MRKLAGFFILMGCVILGSLGCPAKSNSPSSPSNPTNTNTPNPTGTPTGTASATATATYISTTGITMTPNANVTPCGAAPTFTPTYNFSNGVQCWIVDAYTQANGGVSCVTGIGTTSVIQHTGHNALCLTINNSSPATVDAQVEVVWELPQ